jgi:hypothetical protein
MYNHAYPPAKDAKPFKDLKKPEGADEEECAPAEE